MWSKERGGYYHANIFNPVMIAQGVDLQNNEWTQYM